MTVVSQAEFFAWQPDFIMLAIAELDYDHMPSSYWASGHRLGKTGDLVFFDFEAKELAKTIRALKEKGYSIVHAHPINRLLVPVYSKSPVNEELERIVSDFFEAETNATS